MYKVIYEIDGEFIDTNEDATSWNGFELGEMRTPEDCLGMIMTMISDSEYSEESDIEEIKMMLDDIYQYAELGLQLSRE